MVRPQLVVSLVVRTALAASIAQVRHIATEYESGGPWWTHIERSVSPRPRACESGWIRSPSGVRVVPLVAARCPDAIRCADPFHVVACGSDAVDEGRPGRTLRPMRRSGRRQASHPELGTARALLPCGQSLSQTGSVSWRESRTSDTRVTRLRSGCASRS